MRSIVRSSKRGFTLIELMIVVAIVGILAVLAIYGVRKYIANAKTAEARNTLGQISKDASTAYEKESMPGAVLAQTNTAATSRKMCGSEAATVPVAAPKGAKYQSAPTDWTVGAGAVPVGFACLKFTMDQPQYYAYGYKMVGADGATLADAFHATAAGDLNGDGVTSLFEVDGIIQTGMVLNVSPNIIETNPEE